MRLPQPAGDQQSHARRRSRRWYWPGIVVALLGWPSAVLAAGEPLTVFAAASLTDALTEIGNAYRAHDHELRFSFAASSTLARQIEAGAPAAIFASASERWMNYLQARQLIDADSRVSPIGNSLVLITQQDSSQQTFQLDEQTRLEPLLGAAGRLAIGDPAHVPAGIYAQQALQRLGWWPALQARTAFANDVRGVLALVERGEAPLGIVYATDAAISKRARVLATFPAATHDPIRYSMALVSGQHDAEAAALLAFMTGPSAMDIFRRYGFQAP